MYKIVYAKTALKDIPKLKSAHLDEKAKELISIIKENTFHKKLCFYLLSRFPLE